MLTYTNISKGLPRQSVLALEVLPDVFQAELKAARNSSNKPRVMIYRGGQAPEWAEDEDEQDLTKPKLLARRLDIKAKLTRTRVEKTTLDIKPNETKKVVAEVLIGDSDTKGKDEKQSKHTDRDTDREVKRERDRDEKREFPEIVIKSEPVDTSKMEVPKPIEIGDEDDAEDRRARARARRAQREEETEVDKEEEERAKQLAEEQEKEKDEESEYETDSEDESAQSRPMLKPVFVSKKARETLEEKERIQAEEIALEKERQERNIERKKQSRALVAQEIVREEEDKKKATMDFNEQLPDDSDDVVDAQLELEAWKLRELKRIQRAKEDREKYEKEKIDKERRRNMTDEEIRREDEATKPQKAKAKFKYMQKYYHKGSYYLEEENTDEAFAGRDFLTATGADAEIDREFLPKVLQVKKFGIKGRTKYTHLTDQDTTTKQLNPWVKSEDMLKTERQHKLAGTGSVTMPHKKKQRTN